MRRTRTSTGTSAERLSLQDVTVTYKKGRPRALDNVSLMLGEGSTVVVGPNGAGKSTLLKVLTGQLRASSGVVSAPERLGYCPQRPVTIPAFTGQKQVEYAGWLAGRTGTA